MDNDRTQGILMALVVILLYHALTACATWCSKKRPVTPEDDSKTKTEYSEPRDDKVTEPKGVIEDTEKPKKTASPRFLQENRCRRERGA